MPRRKQKQEGKCVSLNISMNEKLIEKIDDLIQDPTNLYFAGNRSAFIKHCVLKFFQETENKEGKKE